MDHGRLPQREGLTGVQVSGRDPAHARGQVHGSPACRRGRSTSNTSPGQVEPENPAPVEVRKLHQAEFHMQPLIFTGFIVKIRLIHHI